MNDICVVCGLKFHQTEKFEKVLAARGLRKIHLQCRDTWIKWNR